MCLRSEIQCVCVHVCESVSVCMKHKQKILRLGGKLEIKCCMKIVWQFMLSLCELTRNLCKNFDTQQGKTESEAVVLL